MKKPEFLTFNLCLTNILENVCTVIVPNIVWINMQSKISSFQQFFFKILIFTLKSGFAHGVEFSGFSTR